MNVQPKLNIYENQVNNSIAKEGILNPDQLLFNPNKKLKESFIHSLQIEKKAAFLQSKTNTVKTKSLGTEVNSAILINRNAWEEGCVYVSTECNLFANPTATKICIWDKDFSFLNVRSLIVNLGTFPYMLGLFKIIENNDLLKVDYFRSTPFNQNYISICTENDEKPYTTVGLVKATLSNLRTYVVLNPSHFSQVFNNIRLKGHVYAAVMDYNINNCYYNFFDFSSFLFASIYDLGENDYEIFIKIFPNIKYTIFGIYPGPSTQVTVFGNLYQTTVHQTYHEPISGCIFRRGYETLTDIKISSTILNSTNCIS